MELFVVWCWHLLPGCPAPDKYGCPGHRMVVNPDERAFFEKRGWRL